VGTNENNTDTLILAHTDFKRRKIVLISLPRDLYFRGLKINAYNSLYGIEQLMTELSDITGLKVDEYVMIDMYALIEVINILGGIDIYLEKNLVDPTYITKDNGIFGTLYYPKGHYHLDGIQSLRIARSRYTTSDFDRAKRQQIVLEGIAEKLKSIGISDLNKISKLIKTLATYVKTNFSLIEMVQYYLRYRDYPIDAGNVLDTTNVLYHTFSNLYLIEDEIELKKLELDADFDKGVYILLPRNNDWNLIRWYVRSLIKKSKIPG
jgi:LCP family protein required for cell wall assembly